MTSRAIAGLLAIPLVVTLIAGTSTDVSAAPGLKEVKVDCAHGQTIAQALRKGDERKPLRVIVSGTCHEHVLIDRDDVTLEADPVAGGAVVGLDAGTDVIRVTAARVTLRGLGVTGGRNGISGVSAPSLSVLDCIVDSAGRTGIVFFQGASGTVDGCTIQNNPRDGIAVESATATLTRNTVTHNRRGGILFTDGASGRIGIDNTNSAAGNLISTNGSNGLHVSIGSTAFVGANTISGNGTDPAGALGRHGIGVTNATIDLVGSNTIARNAQHGIFVRSGTLLVGDANFNFSSVNTITGNGTAAPSAGIFAFAGSSAVVRSAVITENAGFGLVLSLRSSGQMSGNTIRDNTGVPPGTGDGIRLAFGSGLFIDGAPAPANTVTGNTGWGVNCTDGEASVVNTGFVILTPPNGIGGVSPGCTGF